MKSTLGLRMKYPDLKLPSKVTDENPRVTNETGDLFKPEIDTPYYNKVENYHKHIKPTLTERETAVYNALRAIQPATMHQVAGYMDRELNTVSGRFSALVEKGFLRISGRGNGKSIYTITDKNPDAAEFSEQRYKED